ncbi:MAG: SLATT domain-containing protein [Gammaproteobacteria bacterium]
MKIEQKQLLKSWRDELGVMMRTHYVLSTKVRLLNYVLGVPCIIIAMLIASYIFFTINQEVVFWVKMLFGLLTLLMAILASLQTFLKYSEQAENHRNASARYQALFNGIDQLLAIPPKDETALGEWCDKLRERWDELNLEAPNIVHKFKREPVEPVSITHEDSYQASAE